MSLLKNLTQSYGHEVSGSDAAAFGHDKKNVQGCDLVVYSGAIPPDNEELVAARQLNIPVMERAVYLGLISLGYDRVVAVAGSHGKTTVTAMTYAACKADAPTLHLGGRMDGCEYIGEKKLFITEACEYRRSFLQLEPDIGVVLNAELDHTDYYKNLADILSAFRQFIKQSKTALINGDDPNLRALQGGHILTFGLSEKNDFTAGTVTPIPGDGHRFLFSFRGAALGELTVRAPGIHSVYNALAAASAATLAGQNFVAIAEGLAAFKGVSRRFEFLGEYNGAAIYTDYAHHPTEITAALGSIDKHTVGRVMVVFEPHTFSRTATFLQGFVSALSAADEVILAPVFRSREKGGKADSGVLSAALQAKTPCTLCDSYKTVNAAVRDKAQKGDIVIYMGAGDIDGAGRQLLTGG